jgi:ornithine decarboxylase
MDFSVLRTLTQEHGTPLLALSTQRVRHSFRMLHDALPGVGMYYALKSNAQPELLSALDTEGCCFDVSTNAEIDTVRSCGIDAQRCLNTHPIKRDSDIRYALQFGISLFVADNEYELDKLVAYADRCSVLIRMSIQNPHCMVNLGHKYGAPPEKTFALIETAVKKGLTVRGIAFHVGSQNENPLKYIEALEYCRDIYTKAALNDITFDMIDIGGGFPIDYLQPVIPIRQFCRPINEYLERYFANYTIIAEPGRFLSGTAMTLAARIIGKSLRHGVRWYYIDDGIYGSFSGKLYDHAEYPLSFERGGRRYMSTIAGPTCDSIDVLYENIPLPELEINDLLFFDSMGAYTLASASTFNGFPKPKVVVV